MSLITPPVASIVNADGAEHANKMKYYTLSLFHINAAEIMKQMKRVLPYDLHSLTWNKPHKVNDEEVGWHHSFLRGVIVFDILVLLNRNIAIAGVLVIGT